MDDQQFSRLLDRFDLSRKGYRKVRKGVKKRIRRHMLELDRHSMDGYLDLLDADEKENRQALRLMSVSISRFFRDRLLWQALGQDLLPRLTREYGTKIRIWSAGCACGEEIYSLKILWHEFETGNLPPSGPDWLATDINVVYLEKARKGLYPRSSLKEVPGDMVTRYFHSPDRGRHYAVSSELKQGIAWQEHDLLSEPPDSDFHMVFLRNNLLTYYGDASKIPALRKIVGSLLHGGFLIIGSHEKIPREVEGLVASEAHPCIFQRLKEKRPSLDFSPGLS